LSGPRKDYSPAAAIAKPTKPIAIPAERNANQIRSLLRSRSTAVPFNSQNPAPELRELGGAKVILATATGAEAMQACLGGLGPRGTLLVIGAVPKLEVPPFPLIGGNQSVRGWYSGTAIDSQDTLESSVLAGVRSLNEINPMARVGEAYDRMMSGKARFRVVLTM